MMKNIHVLLLLLSLQSTLSIAQELDAQKSDAQVRSEIIDQAIIDFPVIVTCFDFLQKQQLIDQSFHDYLSANINQKTELEFNFGETIEKAEDIIITKIRDPFLTMIRNAIDKNSNLNTLIDDPLLLYIIQHKDGCMNSFIHQWVNLIDKKVNNETLLHRAVTKNNESFVFFLISCGANINIQKKSGWTPLYTAVAHNYTRIADILITAGADLNIPDAQGETALHCATLTNSQDIPFKLIAAGANLNYKDKYGCTALHRASTNNKATIAQMLIHNKAQINIQDNNGNTPLFGAAKNNRMSIVQMLIKAGANIDIKNNNNSTADQITWSPKIEAFLKEVRRKNLDDHKMEIFEKQIKKDWR